MKIKILSWNVRGANDSDKRKIIKSVIKSNKVDVVCLQETKIKDMSTGIVRSLGALYSMMESGGLSMFPSERIWRARVPPKVAFFVWEAWGKVLTQE